jgi:hypothetical protein
MFPGSTKSGGQCAIPGPLDVCKTPAPPAPVPPPIPYPNIAQVAQADGGTCSDKVKFMNGKVCTTKTEVPMTNGDNGGVAGGVVSAKFMGPMSYKVGSSKVKAEGEKIVHLTSMTAHNGKSANMPSGVQVAPSQAKVKVMP